MQFIVWLSDCISKKVVLKIGKDVFLRISLQHNDSIETVWTVYMARCWIVTKLFWSCDYHKAMKNETMEKHLTEYKNTYDMYVKITDL